ncbi:MAG: CarD family transcriptional regulator, partial [Candidatus Fermentibacter daniensis]
MPSEVAGVSSGVVQTERMSFSVSDMVVHPIHGAGRISDISVKNISGECTECVVVDLMVGNAGVLLPVESLD